ncbi:S8 family serine peptidase [Catellatospora sp. KI3]|uniref:S8 family serine peptidase n=1 Tax=Catellatospora sp. KI3 TaxID=3041620 RepID=UPI0024831F55|nr:S8 family serine peptidase [Catellatospora sp. KI3]MDI1464266.1 S8 family serine peptidase [Catellatospora sp. KI3]
MNRPERSHNAKGRDYNPDTLLVRFKPDAAAAAKDKALSARGMRSAGAVAGTGYVRVSAKGAAAKLLRELQADPAVASVSLDYRRKMAVVPNDSWYATDQGYLNTIRLPQAWDRTKGSTSQVIAVLDTGVNGTHQDLTGRVLAGYDAIANTPIAAGTNSDDNGHGSEVAGIAAANTGNGIGVAGAAWTAQILPVKVLDSEGYGYDSDIAEGVIWAADHGAKVINMSLGGVDDDPVLHDAVTYATDKGAVVVVAAGNDGNFTPQYPAAYPEVLAVGATDAAGKLTDFSSLGDWVDVAAPGFDMISTGNDGNYWYGMAGTSFAAPLVSGVAALVRTVNPSMTPAQVIAKIKTTARDAGPHGLDPYYGNGIVDAFYAVGGTATTDFAQAALGTNESNDVPARATAFASSVTGTIAVEGDVDWYRWENTDRKPVQFRLAPPAYNGSIGQNMDAVLTVYDQNLQRIGQADSADATATEQLDITLPAGTYYVAVRNYNGAVDSRPYTLSVTPGLQAMFQPYQTITTGSVPENVVIGDVTGDGRNDIVLVMGYLNDPANDYKLVVYPQGAYGRLMAPVKYTTQIQYNDQAGIALLDADGDTRLDVAIATSRGVQIFRQSAAGALTDAGLIPNTLGAQLIAAADMDADGDTDLVVSSATVTAVGTKLLTREANGSFTPSTVSADFIDEVELGDVDGDARPDVVGFNSGRDGSASVVRVYHASSGWNRTEHGVAQVSTSVSGIEVADVSGDGRADVVATTGAGRLAVFRQNTSGGLDAPVFYLTYNSPKPVEAGDLNGDSRADVVLGHDGWMEVSAFTQEANGTLAAAGDFSLPYAAYTVQGVAVGDVNRDGALDVAVANGGSGLVVMRGGNPATPIPVGEPAFVRSVTPSDFGTGVGRALAPSVVFARPVDAASVTASTVRLVDGRTGANVAGTVFWDAATRTAKVTPAAVLSATAPYRIVVNGVRDQDGVTQTEQFSTTFRTGESELSGLADFRATGASATSIKLSWTLPDLANVDQVVVRMATGNTAPASPTAGTSAYAGTAASATVTVTAATTYSFQAWVRDRSGKYSAGVTARIVPTKLTVSSNSTALTYGGTVSVTGRLTRADLNAAIVNSPVQLLGRAKGTTAWVALGTVYTSTTGDLAFSHKPTAGMDYQWIYRDSTVYGYSSSPLRTVTVRTAVTVKLSKTSFALGGSFTVTGTVAPSHYGKTIYLQQLVSGVWKNVKTTTIYSAGYTFTVKPTARGTFSYRVYMPADTDHAATYTGSYPVKVT